MKVRLNCPIAGCGIEVDARNLAAHLEGVHKLGGKVVLKLHPAVPFQRTPAPEPETEPETEPEKEPEPGEE